jgi:hypothetical protein
MLKIKCTKRKEPKKANMAINITIELDYAIPSYTMVLLTTYQMVYIIMSIESFRFTLAMRNHHRISGKKDN